jgi:hypothetical protein
MLKEKTKIYAIACDFSPNTGEGFLARSIVDLMRSIYAVSVYTDFLMRWFQRSDFLRDRLLPLYVFIICVVQRLTGKRVVLLNYTPIWNCLNGLLTRCGVCLGPITGSALMLPARANWYVRLLRTHVQKLLIAATLFTISHRRVIWCATPSVYKTLKRDGFRQLFFGFPFLSSIKIKAPQRALFDVFIYSGTHGIKNHGAVCQWLQQVSSSDLKVCYIGPNLPQKYSNIQSFEMLQEEAFNSMLACSAIYISFSFEDAGVTGFKALAFGVPVLCPVQSGLGFALDYSAINCFADPFDSLNILHKVERLLPEARQRTGISDECHKVFYQLQQQSASAAGAWLSAL